VLGISEGKVSRVQELFCFYDEFESPKESYPLISVLNSPLCDIVKNLETVQKESKTLFEERCKKIVEINVKLAHNNDKNEEFWRLMEEEGVTAEKRETTLYRFDCGQIMNSSCDFIRHPDTLKMSPGFKKKLKIKGNFSFDNNTQPGVTSAQRTVTCTPWCVLR
jgi:hypothetical protein